MKKKVFTTVFSSFALITLAACSNESKTDSSSSKTSDSTEQTSTIQSSEKNEETSNSKETTLSKDTPKSTMGNDINFSLMVETIQSQNPAIKEQDGEMYKDISIEEGKDTTLIYNYQFSQKPETKVDVDALKPTIVKAMKPAINQMKETFPEVKIQVNYLNPDGSEAASFTITQKDTDKITE